MTKPDITLPSGRTVAELRAAAERATPGPWMWFNGCSWWRLGTATIHNGERYEKKHDAIICPTKDRHDGHPDLIVSADNRAYLEMMDPSTCLALTAENARLAARVKELEKALCAAAIPLEALYSALDAKIGDMPYLSHEMQGGIAEAVSAIRAALLTEDRTHAAD